MVGAALKGRSPKKGHYTVFEWGRNNRLGLARIVADDDWDQQTGWWLNGRLLGRYLSVVIPWRTVKGRKT